MSINEEKRDAVITGVRDAYDTIAEHFAQTRQTQWEEVVYLLEQYVQPDQTLLDIGAGGGRVAQLASKIKAKYIGTDISPQMVNVARKQFPHAEFFVGDMQHLPLEDTSVDHILALASLHHLPDTESRLIALREMTRVLRPGGMILLLNWNLFQPRFWKLRLLSLKLRLLHGRAELGLRDVLVPWKNAKRQVEAERYYHAFSKRELAQLVSHIPSLEVQTQYYELHGMHVTRRKGANLVTVIRKIS